MFGLIFDVHKLCIFHFLRKKSGSDIVFDSASISALASTIASFHRRNPALQIIFTYLERDEDVEHDFFVALEAAGTSMHLLEAIPLQISPTKFHKRRKIMIFGMNVNSSKASWNFQMKAMKNFSLVGGGSIWNES